MTKEEKDLKNDVLDILQDYLYVAQTINKGDALAVKAGVLNKEIKETKEIIRRFRDVTITEEK